MAISVGNGGYSGKRLHVSASQEPHRVQLVEEQLAYAVQNPPIKVITANGTSSASTSVTLPANALVDEYLVKVQAARAGYTEAKLAGEVRQSSSSPLEVVIDFGAMVTVSGIRIPYIVTDYSAHAWLGSKFDLLNDVSRVLKSRPADARYGSDSDVPVVYSFAQEIRTERLLLIFPDSISFATVQDKLELSLPDLPSDLAITLNGGVPVWQYAGMVQPGVASELGEEQWSDNAVLLVSLTSPLQALAGDATRSDSIPLTIELTSKTSGYLDIDRYSHSLRLLHRQSFNSESDLNFDYVMEGKLAIALDSPGTGQAKPPLLGVQLKLSADFPLQRALPPLGAAANGICELVLGNGKAACVRLDDIDPLVQISGIRIPLSTPSTRAEARVVLWRGKDEAPTEAIEAGVSAPQSWSGEDEQWLSFDFAEPIESSDADVFWAAIMVERGEVSWALAAANNSGHYPVRLGAPSGPWRALPAIFASDTSLGLVAGRLHVLGFAAETKPLAPLQLSLNTNSTPIELTPTKDGVSVQLLLDNPNGSSVTSAELTIINRALGNLAVSEVDVITKEITV